MIQGITYQPVIILYSTENYVRKMWVEQLLTVEKFRIHFQKDSQSINIIFSPFLETAPRKKEKIKKTQNITG